jgi:hypothetical protein
MVAGVNHRAERAATIVSAFTLCYLVVWALVAITACAPMTPLERAKLDAVRDYRDACMDRFSNDPQVRLSAWESCDIWAHRIVGL